MNGFIRLFYIVGLVGLWVSVGMMSVVHAQYPRPQVKLNLPTPLGYVSDYAEVLSPHWSKQIRAVCKELEQRTGVEMIVVTLASVDIEGMNVQDYASALYKGWRIGTAQQERGILILASMEDRQAVVVLGRSLLSVISRQQLDELSTQYFIPMFREQDLGSLFYQAIVRLAASAGEVQFLEPAEKKSSRAGFWMNLSVAMVMLYILWRFTRPERRHPFQRWRRGEYWSTGQGGFGSNFGGFGGRMEE
ncbi:MAG: TPM domain-containing protein [Nitrospirales bacterium]|nr:TPM domain-containing protein [Nitrospira sp.]MDR4502436.1 TPM domain-containing protein [Nitrospirales bacterium]